MEQSSISQQLSRLSDIVPRPKSEYLGEDGLQHCAKCHEAVQTVVTVFGQQRIVRCICRCRQEELKVIEEKSRRDTREQNRRNCFDEAYMATWTFENDDRSDSRLSDAFRRYADNFHTFYEKHKGLLLYGGCGTGKTFFAACIANRLIDMDYTVIMTNFATLTNQLQATFAGKQEIMENLCMCSLLIIDDLGAERSTEYMNETMCSIVDRRYRSGKPLIITTNLTPEQIKKPTDIWKKRIYDKILGRCVPIQVERPSRRRQELKDTYKETMDLLGL